MQLRKNSGLLEAERRNAVAHFASEMEEIRRGYWDDKGVLWAMVVFAFSAYAEERIRTFYERIYPGIAPEDRAESLRLFVYQVIRELRAFWLDSRHLLPKYQHAEFELGTRKAAWRFIDKDLRDYVARANERFAAQVPQRCAPRTAAHSVPRFDGGQNTSDEKANQMPDRRGLATPTGDSVRGAAIAQGPPRAMNETAADGNHAAQTQSSDDANQPARAFSAIPSMQPALAENIERLREEGGLGIDDLSRETGVDPQTRKLTKKAIHRTSIIAHLHGKKAHPGTLKKYADTFSRLLNRAVTVAELKTPYRLPTKSLPSSC
jgi:hypothetical protein